MTTKTKLTIDDMIWLVEDHDSNEPTDESSWPRQTKHFAWDVFLSRGVSLLKQIAEDHDSNIGWLLLKISSEVSGNKTDANQLNFQLQRKGHSAVLCVGENQTVVCGNKSVLIADDEEKVWTPVKRFRKKDFPFGEAPFEIAAVWCWAKGERSHQPLHRGPDRREHDSGVRGGGD